MVQIGTCCQTSSPTGGTSPIVIQVIGATRLEANCFTRSKIIASIGPTSVTNDRDGIECVETKRSYGPIVWI